MFSRTWETSERKNYNLTIEKNLRIKMSDGVEISADVFRPDSPGKFPGILGVHAFGKRFDAMAPIRPTAMGITSPEGKSAGGTESGDPNFFVRRGYVQVIVNVRGTGRSGGTFHWYGARERQDNYEIIEWMAKQDWCTGSVGMFGPSYFGTSQIFVAALNPPSLKCIFAPWAQTDWYRDNLYRGGIFNWYDRANSVKRGYENVRYESETRKRLGEQGFKEAIEKALQDDDITAIPELVEFLKKPDEGANGLVVDLILNPYWNTPFWEERRMANYDKIKVPAYIGGCWATYGTHLPGAFRGWENLAVPKKMIIGPPMYLERPLYQLQYESLRWFDYWLKGMDTGIMDEPPVRLFVMGTNQWKNANDWPLPETKWTPFYLHEKGLLSEHEFWPNEGQDTFEDSVYFRGSVEYYSPKFVEDTEIIGPVVLRLYASTTDDEVLWIASLREFDQEGNEKVLTRGWLRGSHMEIEPKLSKPWAPFHPHSRSVPLTPGKIYQFDIPIIPMGNMFKAGSRIALRISCADDPPNNNFFEKQADGNIRRQHASRVTIYHDTNNPSQLLLPITMGNIIGTWLTGGEPYV